MKAKARKAKPKKKVIKRKIMYKCVHLNQKLRMVVVQEPNEHGAMNDKVLNLPIWELTFTYEQPNARAYSVPEGVLFANFTLVTTDKNTADKYIVGEDYAELPTK